MQNLDSTEENPLLAGMTQPKGLRYLFGTWSGRILLINGLVFLYICYLSGNIFTPDTTTLLALGAKDSVKLAQGELWRLIAPIFIHVGVIHFAFNSYFLYVVGFQLERLLGGPWFLAIYLISGIAGNIASATFSVNMSAGASSSLFGLLGAGFLLERTIGTHIKKLTGRRPRNRAYAMTVVINLGFGLLIPFIDNSAHIGGLVGGVLLTAAMINLRPNNLHKRVPALGISLLLILTLICCGGIYASTSPQLVINRLVIAGDSSDDSGQKIYHYSQALALDPDIATIRIKRARALFAEGTPNYAFNDLRAVIIKGSHDVELTKFAEELDRKGQHAEAWELRQMLAHHIESQR